MEEKRKKILYLIQLPSPVHGVSIMNEAVYNSSVINRNVDKFLLEIKFSNSTSSLQKFTLKKVFIAIVLLFRLLNKLIKIKPDLVYFTLTPFGLGLFRDFFSVLLIKAFRTKIIFHIHNKGIAEKLDTFFYKRIFKFVFNKSYIIQLSDFLLKTETGKLNLKKSKSFVIGNGIKSIYEIKRRFVSEQISFLFFSNLISQKGIFILIEAFREIAHEFKNVHLIIAGSSWDKRTDRQIHYLINKYRLRTRITIRTDLSEKNKNQLFTDSDIFIYPTFYDSFPLVILEAMQAGLPIISTFEGAIPEIVTNEENGLLVQQKNSKELVQKMKLLIENKELREELGENAQKTFHEYYTFDIFEEKMSNVFKEILFN